MIKIEYLIQFLFKEMFRLQLLKNLCNEYPNAYVLIGEKFYPTRSELFTFEMFRLARKANMFKFHKKLPIILTLEEDQLPIYEEFEKYLIFGTPINFKHAKQIDFILFLKSICSNKEIEAIFCSCVSPLQSIYKLFTITTWIELMEYGLEPLFLNEYDRMEICVAIHRQTYDFKEKWSNNVYGKELSEIKPQTLEQTNPLFYKALTFYKISLQHIKDRYPFRKYSNSCGSN